MPEFGVLLAETGEFPVEILLFPGQPVGHHLLSKQEITQHLEWVGSLFRLDPSAMTLASPFSSSLQRRVAWGPVQSAGCSCPIYSRALA